MQLVGAGRRERVVVVVRRSSRRSRQGMMVVRSGGWDVCVVVRGRSEEEGWEGAGCGRGGRRRRR